MLGNRQKTHQLRMNMRPRLLVCHFLTMLAVLALLAWTSTVLAQGELHRVLSRLMAPPRIKTEPGFSAKMLVPPGELYDPLFMIPHGGNVWLTDDGGEEDGTGSRIVSVDRLGKVSIIVGITTTVPLIGWGFAPPSFGKSAGEIVALSQAKTGFEGIFVNHVIQRLDPSNHYKPAIICTLPTTGSVGHGIPGVGADARFGPSGSPFGERFFAATLLNDFIYQVNGAGECTPFANFERYGGAGGIAFTPDGGQMLAAVAVANRPGDPLSGMKHQGGLILSVSPDGKINDKPFAKGFDSPLGMDFSPKGFGSYDGELFVADSGETQAPVPMTQPLNRDGKVYRVERNGEIKLVASGFVNPAGVRFVGNRLWVTDINGDFIGGKRELPDGFMVEIEAASR
jgi:hypothetical protein